MWYPRKIHSHPDLTLRRFWIAYQISGRNFFQVGDDVTTRDFKTFPYASFVLQSCFTIRCTLYRVCYFKMISI
ncbi:hypothetical protein Hanom_Chr00s000001g01593771 [Helianthus anomalus]